MSAQRLWDRFRNRMVFEARLEAVTALRIGRGQESFEPSGSDLPVLRGVDETPFIPGSSLRGVLRAYVERVVRAYEPAPNPGQPWRGRGACNPLSEAGNCLPAEQVKSWRQAGRRGETDSDLPHLVWEASCRVCRLFGSPFLASRVRIADLAPLDPLPVTTIRDGVAINREKETVENKYDFEVVEPGAAFALKVVAENVSEAELGLLFLGLQALARGEIEVGGFKGRGLGRVTLTAPTLRWVTVDDQRAFRAYLRTGALPTLDDPEARTGTWIDALLAELEEATA